METETGNGGLKHRRCSGRARPLKAETRVRIPLGPPGEVSGISSGFPHREHTKLSPQNAAKYPRITPRSGSEMAARDWCILSAGSGDAPSRTKSAGATIAECRPELQ